MARQRTNKRLKFTLSAFNFNAYAGGGVENVSCEPVPLRQVVNKGTKSHTLHNAADMNSPARNDGLCGSRHERQWLAQF
jgi:hypothetical protein